MGESRKVYKVSVGKPKQKKKPLRRPRHRQEDGVKTDLRESGWGVWYEFSWLRIGTGGRLF
jgi:hypothetical protein